MRALVKLTRTITEFVLTTRNFIRTVTDIRPEWYVVLPGSWGTLVRTADADAIMQASRVFAGLLRLQVVPGRRDKKGARAHRQEARADRVRQRRQRLR